MKKSNSLKKGDLVYKPAGNGRVHEIVAAGPDGLGGGWIKVKTLGEFPLISPHIDRKGWEKV